MSCLFPCFHYSCRVEVTIRVYDPRDAADLADVFFRSVRQVALSDYTAAQVRAWAPEPRTAEWAHTEASELARRLFERKGFAVVERRDMVIRGVAIHNYRMAKDLDLTAPLPTWPAAGFGPPAPALLRRGCRSSPPPHGEGDVVHRDGGPAGFAEMLDLDD